ncbi:hypothetical protein COW81_02715 [Candidatus Campbellbacteria bacterium CG22_combo_CG10-13_8_21_14_all_36_13]|uniref:Uncharacterized protein n=1 Tax=Candidatus Campbellbacteria bacterium CG22_combo_CG10-13_8_21_14_all_36_13 TaxID=1974529 RepID=A0A2H0DZL1_9BACT|nr:MAG: hypothetical protein COW81_02715 [Candidatus Campbellbacteria bacterium CG22_combo_CG10-13_8_21_14_all_36_13]
MQNSITFFNFEYIYQLIYYLITGDKNIEFLEPIWNILMIVGYLLTLFFIIGIVYSLIRINRIRKEENQILQTLTEEAMSKKSEPTNARWLKILEHLDSHNENDWRLAIIEADLILEEMMTHLGYHQEALGEKLKAVEKSDFNTIEKAWEAHKIRNRIAHEGSSFKISQHEARRVIGLYQNVFEEFEFL